MAAAFGPETVMTGPEIVKLLGQRGMLLFLECQRLCDACASFGTASQQLLDVLHGRSNKWPTAPGAERLRATVFRSWTQLTTDISSYARQISAGSTEGSTEYYDDYLRRVVLSKLKLESTSPPADLAHSKVHALIRKGDIAELSRIGVVVISSERVISAAKTLFDPKRLQSELALLHSHGAISPTSSTCSPGTHGVNLRSDTVEERTNYLKQRTPHVLGAMDFLRALPAALEEAGYRFLDGAERLAVPGVCLVSAYPPGAQYLRHLDCIHVRALTCILYANDDRWDLERDGGGLVVEPTAGPVAQQTAGAGSVDGISTFGGEPELPTREVTPRGATLVIFESRRVWHAVKPSKRLRYATTLWVYAKEVTTGSAPGLRAPAHAGGAASGGAAVAIPLAAKALATPLVTPLAAASQEWKAGPSQTNTCPLLTIVSRNGNGGTAWAFV